MRPRSKGSLPVAIPLSIIALIIGVWQFNAQQIFDNQKKAEQQKIEFQNLKDQQQQTTLETYLDRMSDLLFTQHLNRVSAKGQRGRM